MLRHIIVYVTVVLLARSKVMLVSGLCEEWAILRKPVRDLPNYFLSRYNDLSYYNDLQCHYNDLLSHYNDLVCRYIDLISCYNDLICYNNKPTSL